MKVPSILLAASLLAGLTVATPSADAAEGRRAAFIGGVVAGIITGEVIDHVQSRNHRGGYYHSGNYSHGNSRGSSNYGHYSGGYRHPQYRAPVQHRPQPSGYYETVRTKHWEPEQVIITYDRCGREIRRFIPGRWVWKTEQVWVSTAGHCR